MVRVTLYAVFVDKMKFVERWRGGAEGNENDIVRRMGIAKVEIFRNKFRFAGA